MTDTDFREWLEPALARELAEIPLPAAHPALARYRVTATVHTKPVVRRSLAVAAAFALALTSIVVASAAPAAPAARTLLSDAGRVVHSLIGLPPDSESKPPAPVPLRESDRDPGASGFERPAGGGGREAGSEAERGEDRPAIASLDAEATEPESGPRQTAGERRAGGSTEGRGDGPKANDGEPQVRAEEKTSDFSTDRGYSGNSVIKPSGNGTQTQEESTRNDP